MAGVVFSDNSLDRSIAVGVVEERAVRDFSLSEMAMIDIKARQPLRA
jgi:hypothetical protein